MTRKSFCFALAGICLSVVFLIAASKPVGSWECTSTTPTGGEMKWTLTLKEVGGKLVGSAGSDDGGEISIEDAKYDNGTLTFKVPFEGCTYEVTLRIEGDKLDGSWKGGGENGIVKGTKKA